MRVWYDDGAFPIPNHVFFPAIIRNALAGNPIPIYGDGKNMMDWLYMLDQCKGIDLAYHQGKSGETSNIGGRNENNSKSKIQNSKSLESNPKWLHHYLLPITHCPKTRPLCNIKKVETDEK